MSLADIRARLVAQDNKSSNTNKGGLVYPHWNIAEGSTAIVRFLPDGNSENPFFWAERAMIKLPFAGIKGGGSNNETTVQVPCMDMYEGNVPCPILAEVSPWFKDASMEDMARKYWKKRTYVFQGFVHQDPMNEDNAPENPIRKFMISPSIFSIIKASLMDPEMEELPTDYTKGLDFRIVKIQKGQYANYGTSTWSRKETALTEDESKSIETFGLNDLKGFLPPKPDANTLKIIHEMFEASVDGQQYDVEKWGNYYRPWGVDKPEGSVNVVTPVADVSTVGDSPFETPSGATEVITEPAVTAPASNDKAADILAQIRARQNA
jgi:hypothetical protein